MDTWMGSREKSCSLSPVWSWTSTWWSWSGPRGGKKKEGKEGKMSSLFWLNTFTLSTNVLMSTKLFCGTRNVLSHSCYESELWNVPSSVKPKWVLLEWKKPLSLRGIAAFCTVRFTRDHRARLFCLGITWLGTETSLSNWRNYSERLPSSCCFCITALSSYPTETFPWPIWTRMQILRTRVPQVPNYSVLY